MDRETAWGLAASVVDPDGDVDDMLPVFRAMTGRTENVGVRWTGTVTAPVTGDYTFSAVGDNGFRLWVGGTEPADLLIDFWVNRWDEEQTATRAVHLVAGEPVPFRFEQFQNVGGANVHLRWAAAGAGVAKTAVPGSAFSPPADFQPYEVAARIPANGRSVVLTLPGAVGGTSGVASHLSVPVDGTDYPVSSVAVGSDPRTLVVTLGAPVLAGSFVRVVYDGQGGLTAGGAAVPDFNAGVDNTSTYRLTTRWAKDVDPKAPLPEYPRPQLTRERWANLNGTWDLVALGSADATPPTSWADAEDVVVPYPIESELSGVGRHEDHVAYHRTFTVPASWGVGTKKNQQRLQLHFGAVDHRATVWVNGTQVAEHTGGYDAFSVDVTAALRKGANDLVVRVTDTTGDQARGKQSSSPSGIFYTASSGIWQTVWLEPVERAHVAELDLTPRLAASGDAVDVTATVAGASADATVFVTARDARGKKVATTSGPVGEALTLRLGKAHRWTPDDPYLYALTVRLQDGSSRDTVGSYVGVRSIEVDEVDGKNRVLLNGERTFLLSTLDQGFWPDGVYTAPTDEALAWDVRQTKQLGFNTIRKHIKVEPQRWYYHADRLGMLVLQDMPSGSNADAAQREQWEHELATMIDQHDASPSIIGWVPFNEGWGEWDLAETARVADEVKELDPTRLVNAHSGMNCCSSHGDPKAGDLLDWHQYTGPAAPSPDATRAAFDGEHGGYSLSVLGHTWPGGSVNPYGEVADPAALTTAYVGNTAQLVGLARDRLSGSVYTQITDVEGEVNGFWTYDRRVLKMDRAKVRAVNRAVIAAGEPAKPGRSGLTGVGAWSFDTASGVTSPDSSGRAGAATLVGGATLVPGAKGTALGLDGVAAQATASVPKLDTTQSYSVSARVRADELPGSYVTAVAAEGATGSSPFFLQYSGSSNAQQGWAMSLPGGPRAIAGDVPVEAGRWYHLVGVRDADAGTLAVYVDGALASSVRTSATFATTGTVTIGRAQWEGHDVDFLHGAVDEVRVFDRALGAAEVARLAR